jgi:hypothetical protein
MKSSLNKKLPMLGIAIVLLSCLVIDIDLHLYTKKYRVIEHDVHHYYGYLPLVFIYDDVEIDGDYMTEDGKYHIWHEVTPEGVRVLKTTSGLAILYSPFFFAAHGYAKHFSDEEANGFTRPYKIALLISSIFYLWLGLFFLSNLLLRIGFRPQTIFLTLIFLGLGTHLLFYSTLNAAYPHVYNFTLFAVFLYLVQSWVSIPKYWKIGLIGLVLGLITVIRPTNLIIGLALILWKKRDASWGEHVRFLLQRKTLIQFSLIPFFAVVPLIPQFLYWYHITGEVIYYSYGEEGFFFDSPQLLNGLFSFRKGWLIYTPAMAFALIGLFFMKKSLPHLRPLIFSFVIINTYVIFSWWCWWYGGSFGQRAMIDSYALLAIPLAATLEYLVTHKDKFFSKLLLFGVIPFFIWLNIFQSFQYEKGSLHYDAMTKELYLAQFGKYKRVDGFYDLTKSPDYDAARKGEEEFTFWLFDSK